MTMLCKGAALFLSQEELADAHLTPESLTQQEALPLICRALRPAGQPIPPQLEVRCFPSAHGALFFLRTRMEDLPSDCYLSVTFS